MGLTYLKWKNFYAQLLYIFSNFPLDFISRTLSQYFFQYFLQNLFLFHFLTFLLQILAYAFCFRKTFYTHILYLYIFVKYCYKFYLHLYVLYIIFYLNKLYNFQFSLSNCDLDLMRRLASLRTSKCILKVYEFG